jgi:hypothetical protein
MRLSRESFSVLVDLSPPYRPAMGRGTARHSRVVEGKYDAYPPPALPQKSCKSQASYFPSTNGLWPSVPLPALRAWRRESDFPEEPWSKAWANWKAASPNIRNHPNQYRLQRPA